MINWIVIHPILSIYYCIKIIFLKLNLNQMSLEDKSNELKEIIATYDTQWFLGNLSNLITNIVKDSVQDQLGNLSSPMRQLYFLGGLLITTNDRGGLKINYTEDEWKKIIELLNEIEREYDRLFYPNADEVINDEWIKIREVAMPSFISYFNEGPLNYEEQTITWVTGLYSNFDDRIESEIGIKTRHFLQFYENLDKLIQQKFSGFATGYKFDERWLNYTKIEVTQPDDVPIFIRELGNERKPLYTFMADHGIINRFKPEDIVGNDLELDHIYKILRLISCKRGLTEFIYYTSTNPGNPLYEFPIVDIGDGLFQIFEIKQVMHAIDRLLERICIRDDKIKPRFIIRKGKLLEDLIINLLKKFFKKDYKCFNSYYVDGCEQDILFLWKNYAFIVEAKGYNIREPLRDPERAYVRLKEDFKTSIGYGYKQTNRVEQKFLEQTTLRIEDEHGKLIEEINTQKYDQNDFSIIVNLKSFGQIQNNLSYLLEIDDDANYPWVVKYDDLEVFILTLLAKKKTPEFLVKFLTFRENLHGRLICSDELQICGAYLTGNLSEKILENDNNLLMINSPDFTAVFDQQYRHGMGFENEKYLQQKKDGNTLIL